MQSTKNLRKKEYLNLKEFREKLFEIETANSDCIIVHSNSADSAISAKILAANLKDLGVFEGSISLIKDKRYPSARLPGAIAKSLNDMNINGVLPDKKHYLFCIGVNVSLELIQVSLTLSYDVKSFSGLFTYGSRAENEEYFDLLEKEVLKNGMQDKVHIHIPSERQSLSKMAYDLFDGTNLPEIIKTIDSFVCNRKTMCGAIGKKVVCVLERDGLDVYDKMISNLAFNSLATDIETNRENFYNFLIKVL